MKPGAMIKVYDLETTGLTPADAGVCEIAWCGIVATITDLAGDAAGWEVSPHQNSYLVNPHRPIPPEVSAVHHLIDEDVASGDDFGPLCRALFNPDINNPELTALAAHSAKFEQQWLTPDVTGPLPWICTYKAALRLWPDAPSHSNQALRYWRRPEGLDRGIASVAHRAFPDAYVTAFLLRDMLNSGATVDQLVQWSTEPALQVRCHIGKNRGMLWREVDDGFLDWVSTRDFDEDVIFTVRTEIARREEEWRKQQAAPAIDDEAPF